MELNTIGQQMAAPAPTPAPTPMPDMAMPNPAPAPAATPMMESGGEISFKSLSSFIKTVNWVEVMFYVGAGLGIAMVIRYYSYKLKEEKQHNATMQSQINDLTSKMASFTGAAAAAAKAKM